MRTGSEMVGVAAGVLAGREPELRRLRSTAAKVAGGVGSLVLIDGERGIGKTAVLDAAESVAVEQRWRIVRAAARAPERDIPFATLRALLRGHPEALDSARSLGGATPADDEFSPVSQLLAMIDRWCDSGPVAVLLDDAQWVDSASLIALQRLAETVATRALLFAVAARSVSGSHPLSGFLSRLHRLGALRLRLEPLDEQAITDLAQHVVGAPIGPELAAMLAAVGGNPRYASELMIGLVSAGAVTVVGGVAVLVSPDAQPSVLPRSLTDTVLESLDALPASTQRLVSVAAVLGPTIEAAELSLLLGVPVINVWASLESGMEAGLLARVAGELVFRGDLIRRVYVDRLTPHARAALRSRAVETLIAIDAPVDRIAHHVALDTGPLDAAALNWVLRSADQVVAQRPEQAVAVLDRALATTDSDVERADLRLQLATALLRTGRPADAATNARAALVTHPRGARHPSGAALRWLLAQACFTQGQLEAATHVAATALSLPNLEAEEQARFLGLSALAHCFLNHFDVAEKSAMLSISIGETCGDALGIAWGCRALGTLRYAQGFLDEANQLADRVLATFETAFPADRSYPFDTQQLRSRCLIELDRFADARETLNLVVRDSQRDRGACLAANLFERARIHFLAGRWDDALADLEACSAAPDRFGIEPVARILAGLIAVRRGTVTDDADAVAPLDTQLASQLYRPLRPWLQALVHEAREQPDRGLAVLATYLPEERTMAASMGYCLYPDLARLASITGDHNAAATVASAAAALDARNSTPSRRGTALLCRGLAEARAEPLTEAAKAFELAGRPLYEAQSYENLAMILAQDDRPAQARSALDTAMNLYHKLDARGDIARAHARLRRHGLRHITRTRPTTGWAALTPTEHTVADLIAQGHSNRDIADRTAASKRTIESHVSSILTKLALQSRIQIATAHRDKSARTSIGLAHYDA